MLFTLNRTNASEIDGASSANPKVTPNLNINVNLNLNNLDTSLTKEIDKMVFSATNSAKNKPTSQTSAGGAKKEKSDRHAKKERLDTSNRERSHPKKPFFSPTPKNEKVAAASLIHVRHTSNPDAVDPHFLKEKYYFVI